MDDTTPPETNPQPPAPEPAPAPAGGRRERKPPSPEAAKVAADKKKLKRRLEKLLSGGDAAAIGAAARQLDALDGGDEDRPAEGTGPAALGTPAPEAKAEPAKAPSPEEVEECMGLAGQVVAMVAAPLAGTDFDPMVERTNPVTGEATTMAAELTRALAPVLAKHLPNMVTTPEGNLALVVALWLAPPTLAAVKRKAFGEGGTPANVDGAGVKAA